MSKATLRAARTLWTGLAVFLLNACAPRAVLLREPAQVAGRTDLKVSPEEREALDKEIKTAPEGSERRARALYLLGMAAFEDGRWDEAGKLFQKVETQHKNSGWDQPAIFMMGAALEKLNDPARAFVQYQRLLDFKGLAGLGEASHKACERLASSPMNPEQLEQLILFPAAPAFQPSLRIKSIQNLLSGATQASLSPSARSDQVMLAIEDFRKNWPSSIWEGELSRLALEADKAVPVDLRAVGLLVPLSGAQSGWGSQARQAAELALEEANASLPAAEQLRLVEADEGDNSATALASFRKLSSEDNVVGVLGPLSSDSSHALLPLAASRRTPLLSPGALRPDLAGASPYFFRNGLTLEMQGRSMADHALVELKLSRVAELYPDKPYGRALAGAFASRVSELGGTVLASVSYAARSSDFKDILVGLGGSNPTEMKEADADEKRAQQKSVERASTSMGRVLLQMKAALEAQGSGADSGMDTLTSYRSLSFPARVAVFDFASDTGAAVFNASRRFSDLFARTLGELDELVLLPPDEGMRRLNERQLKPEALSPQLAAEIGRSMNADFVLMGQVAELNPDWQYLSETAKEDSKAGRQAREDIELFGKSQVFKIRTEILEARGGTEVAHAQFEFSKARPQSSNRMGLQALYVPSNADEAVQVASAMSFCDLKLMLLGCDLWNGPQLLQSDNTSGLEGACFSVGFFADSKDPAVKNFVEAYKRKYASIPGPLAAQFYDAARIIFQILRQGLHGREELRAGLSKLHGFEGVSGRTSFDGMQDAVKRVPILKVDMASKSFEEVP
jgi:ABC-type branched-subunit amino acid transport system substrate-binding protein